MASVVEFFIKGQDGLTKPLNNITGASATANNALSKLTATNDVLNQQFTQLGSTVNNVGGFFQSAIGKLPSLLTNPLTAVGIGIVTTVNKAMQERKEKLDWGALVGNGADDIYNGLHKLQPLLGDGIKQTAKDLIGVGVASNSVVPFITQIGAVTGESAEKFTALSGAFVSLQRDGKLTQNTLKAMNDAGFKPLAYISQKYNIQLSDMQDALDDGKISIDMVKAALANATSAGGEFSNTFSNLAQKPTTAWAMFTQQLNDTAANFGSIFLPVVDAGAKALTTALGFLNQGLSNTVSAFSAVVDWGSKNADILTAIAGAIGTGVVAYKAYNAWQVIAVMWGNREVIVNNAQVAAKYALTVATGGLTTATTALNAAFMQSPIGWIVVGLGALVGGVIYAWKHFEGFRKVIYGVWETFKQVFTDIGNLFKQIFSPIGEAIAAIKEGRWGAAAVATGKLLFNITPVGIAANATSFTKAGGFSNVPGAYGVGVNKEIKAYAAGTKTGTDKHFGPVAANTQTNKLNSAAVNSGINAVSGGGSKSITINIGKVIEKFEQHIVGGSKEMAVELERAVEEALVRVIASASAK